MTSAGVVQNDQTASYMAFAADVLFEYPTTAGVFTATGQYLKLDFDDAYKTNFNAGDRLVLVGGMNGQKEGGYVKAAWIAPFRLFGTGMLQPYVLAENWKFAYLLGIENQKIDQVGGGLNYYVKRSNVRLTLRVPEHEIRQGRQASSAAAIDPVTGAPIDKLKKYDTFRIMVQLGVF